MIKGLVSVYYTPNIGFEVLNGSSPSAGGPQYRSFTRIVLNIGPPPINRRALFPLLTFYV